MAILTHSEHGESALRFCTKKLDSTKANITPMRLLVEHMPGILCVCWYTLNIICLHY